MLKAVILLSILASFNLYTILRIVARWFWAKQHILTIIVIGFIFYLAQITGLFGYPLIFSKLENNIHLKNLIPIISWVTNIALGLFSCLFVFTVVIDLLGVILKVVTPPSSLIYLYFNRIALPVITITTLSTVIVGIIYTLTGPTVKIVEIPLKKLPYAFDGFKIVQISDLHVGTIIKHSYVKRVADMVNNLEPNIVAMTGDFIDGHVSSLKDDVTPLADIRSSHGSFFVTGNHEYYWGAEAWIREFTNLGIRVLNNEHVTIQQNDAEIILAGVTDHSTIINATQNQSDPNKALSGSPDNLVKILLAHQPITYIEAHKSGVDLQLSGHTHAGQYFPFTMFIRFFHSYYQGLNNHQNMWIYINKGTGYWGPPLRVGAPAEITLIILRVGTPD
jgi:predicted MPP superfamily phosphohydrolase